MGRAIKVFVKEVVEVEKFQITLSKDEALVLIRILGPLGKDQLLEIVAPGKARRLIEEQGIYAFYSWWNELDQLVKESN